MKSGSEVKNVAASGNEVMHVKPLRAMTTQSACKCRALCPKVTIQTPRKPFMIATGGRANILTIGMRPATTLYKSPSPAAKCAAGGWCENDSARDQRPKHRRTS